MDLKRGIDQAVAKVVDEIRKMSKDVRREEIAQVGYDFSQQRQRDWRVDRRCHGARWQRRRHYR